MTIGKGDLGYICTLVRDRSAIVLDEDKDYLVEARLTPLAKRFGLASVSDLVDQLRTGRPGLHDQVVEAMTTNETSFFRDLHPFEALRTEVLPDLLEGRPPTRAVRIWSAACSSGQEPYSLAMVLDEVPGLDRYDVRIVATDLSSAVLERAAAGRYSQLEVNRGLPARHLVQHFRRDGAWWQVRDSVRYRIEFRTLNLARAWSGLPPFAVVFLRNVLIYFDPETKRSILRRVGDAMEVGGALFLGAAETTLNLDDRFERIRSGRSTWYRLTRP